MAEYSKTTLGGEYWEWLGKGEFRLLRCAQCQTWLWPARWRCATCGSWDQDWVAVDPAGTVFSWTRTWYSFEGVKERAGDLPYVVVQAQITAADGVVVLGVLKGNDDGLKVGAPIRGTIDPPSEKTKGYPAIRWSLVGASAR